MGPHAQATSFANPYFGQTCIGGDDWSQPCPYGWFLFNGGRSCWAGFHPNGNGVCASVLHGVPDLTDEEKQTLAAKCGVRWPRMGEFNAASVDRSQLTPYQRDMNTAKA